MLILAERVRRVLRAGLTEEIERQEREDNDLGPEPEKCHQVVTRTILPGQRAVGVRQQVLPDVPVLSLPQGYVVAGSGLDLLGEDELTVRARLIVAMDRSGAWELCGGRSA